MEGYKGMSNDVKVEKAGYLNGLPEPVKKSVKRIDRNNPLPLYHQLYDALYQVLVEYKLEQGSFFATESLLQDETKMSRSTIRKALEELVRQKYLIRITGKGTFVSITVPKKDIILPELKSMTQEFDERGMKPGSIILQAKKQKPPEDVAKKLNIKDTEEVLFIERIRTGNGIPILYIRGYIPLNIGLNDITDIPNSLYQLIEDCGHTIQTAKQTISATNIPPQIAKLLGVRKLTAGLTMERITFDSHQLPVIYEEGIFRTDLYSYHLSLENKMDS